MAICPGLPASSCSLHVINNSLRKDMNSVPQGASMAHAHKWSIPGDFNLVSDHMNYPLRYTSSTDEFCIKRERKSKDVKHVMRQVREDPLESLILVDAIQRLGIDYLFREEIGSTIERQYRKIKTYLYIDQDLYKFSLCFRMLRQEGYYVPADMFNNFKNKEGKFRDNLGTDIKGLKALYEASQLIIEGEDILDEARNFSSRLLNGWINRLDCSAARAVERTLEYPYHKSLASLVAKEYMRDLSGNSVHERNLKQLAKINFEMVQSIHQEELRQISMWWKDLGLAKELKFVRDQPLKWYAWPMAMLTDPSLSMQRIELTKSISLIYIIDDIFDVHGTLEELTFFSEAVKRWDIGALEQLPAYMKTSFKALYDITNEISHKVYNEHGWNPMDSLRKTWASLCNAFLVEAKWFASGHIPKSEEYLKNGIVSSGVHVVLVHIFFLLGLKHSEDHISGIISAVATILRLWDDLGSAKDEEQDGNDGSYVECYMKEHEREGHSKDFARQHVVNMISNAWKCLNKECLSLHSFSPSFKNASLNMARMVPLMYHYNDDHRLPMLEEHIKSMLYDHHSDFTTNSSLYPQKFTET